MKSPDSGDSQRAFSPEAMSPQKKASWKKRLSKLSRCQLVEVEAQIKELLEEGHFDAELEIASMHFSPVMVHRTIRDQGRRKLQEIYCSEVRCSKCPHGPFWFAFSSSRRKGTKVRFEGEPALPPDLIDKMELDERQPIASFEIQTKAFSG